MTLQLTVPQLAGSGTDTPVMRLTDASAVLGGRTVWSGLTFSLQAGEMMAVLGANGAGKTTLLRTLLGEVAPHQGSVELFGAPPRRGDRRVGYLPQASTADVDLPARPRDLVRLGLDGHRPGWRRSPGAAAAVDRALHAVGAEALADRRLGRLSGGEAQRVRLAATVVAAPRLLLVDEPFTGLDQRARHEVGALLDRLRRDLDAAVVVVTHDVDPVLPFVDTVAWIAAGRAAVGPATEVLTKETLTALHGVPVEVATLAGRTVVVVGNAAESDPGHCR